MSAEWRKCTTCKKSIPFLVPYWVCNVSTCRRKRIGLVFCGMNCWDAHLPVFRHKEAWAEECRAPSEKVWAEVLAGTRPDPTYPKHEVEVEPQEEVIRGPQRRPHVGPPVVIRRKPS